MAALVEMGEVEEIHTKEDTVQEVQTMNGELNAKENSVNNEDNVCTVVSDGEDEPMEVSDEAVDMADDNDNKSVEEMSGDENNEEIISNHEDEVDHNYVDNTSVANDNDTEVHNIDNSDDEVSEVIDEEDAISNSATNNVQDSNDLVEIDDNDLDPLDDNKITADDGTVVCNDSGEGDVMIVDGDTPKENGDVHIEISDSEAPKTNAEDDEVIHIDTSIKKKKKVQDTPLQPMRRSSRNVKKRSYADSDNEEDTAKIVDSEESDIEEVLPQDPLAVSSPLISDKLSKRSKSSNATIVVKDTKRLVEIATKSSPSSSGKKEPTLVIIDTNSILSGRGPVPVTQKPPIISNYNTLPMALPAQGIYPPNMRATITPIPISTPASANSKTASMSVSSPSMTFQPPLLPTLTDDMFVVEAPSFIVPYVYEKPPLKDLRDFVKDVRKQIEEQKRKEELEESKKTEGEDSSQSGDIPKNDDNNDQTETDKDIDRKDDDDDVEITDFRKSNSYFDSPLGKFFIEIGSNLVQEFVQTDLLKQQKRKRDREGGQNATTNKTIQTLMKNLEYSKENNVSFRMQTKKCEFCSFKTESALAMSFHLETPHMKNFVYRCNFCSYEVRSPHDILLHMESTHGIRARLERAPAFHQCPNCPFEDNQKGKLSRHLVGCIRKFKPTRNLEPPMDWEPPAKIPRLPRMKQQGLNASAAMYQAMGKNQYHQYMNKMPGTNQTVLGHRGRGRPTLGTAVAKQQPLLRSPTGMVYKQAMSGGSVLVPTSYQLSGNQLYQVVGGPELGGRLGPVGPMALVPNIPTASSTIIQQQNSNKSKTIHQPSISITPLPRTASSSSNAGVSKPGDSNAKNSFVICEICDGYIKDLEQLRNHMQWIHKVKIHPKMIYNRPPLNCQKCQFRFFTDQGLERHLLGSHGLVTSSMQEAANKSKDAGRCPVCGRVYQWKLLNHVARDHNMTLKPAHLSYKCTVCTATFGMYKQFENHVYSAHSVVAKRVIDKKSNATSSKSDNTLLKPLKINDEITIIPQPAKSSSNGASTSKEGSPSASRSSNFNSKNK